MKTLTPIARTVVLFALVIIGALAVQPALAATTVYLDVNGTSPGFWNGVNPVSCTVSTTTNWTTDTTGVAAPVLGAAGDNFEFGFNPGDFNGAQITFTPAAEAMAGTNFSINSTNCTVTWAGTGNAHFNSSPTFVSVTNGSTLIWTSTANNGGFNFNGKSINFTGGGTDIFNTGFLANGQAGVDVMNMPGGTIILKQTAKSNYGDTSGANFTITNGTLIFASQSALLNAFAQFTNSTDQIHINGGAIDNTSGSPGVIGLGTTPSPLGEGQYTIGGNFTFVGSNPLNTGSNFVTLQASPTITVLASTLTIGGPISGAFGITNAGPGTLALTNVNTYTGPTVVNGGTLVTTTLSTNGNYIVGDNAALDVFVDNVGQTLSMSNLAVGAVTGGTLEFDLGAFSNPNSAATAPVQLGTGSLTVNGASTPINFVSIAPITNFPVVIPLVHYGTASGNLGSLTTGTFPSVPTPYQGYISNDTVNSLIDLVLTTGSVGQPPGPAKTVTWIGQTNGVSDGNWDIFTTNWSNAGNATNYANITTTGGGDNAIFDDTLRGTSAVNLTRALDPETITMNNNNSNYVFVGSGKITGSTALTMNGTGQLTLDNSTNDDFSGGIVINSGTLQIGNNDANGGIGTGLITNNGTLIFARTDTNLMVSQAIAGTGALTNNGTGTVTLGSPETLTGPVVVNAGTLAFNGPNSNVGGVAQSSNVLINSGATVLNLGDNAFIGSTGLTPVTILANGLLTGNTTSSHLEGQITLLGGTIAMGGSGPFSTSFGTWGLQGTPVAVTVPGTNVTSVMSAQNMVPAETGGTIFDVTNGFTPSGIDLLVSGTFINGTSLADTGIIKNGNGLMVLDGNNGYAHGTTVNGGPLQLGMPTDTSIITAAGTGAVALATGATLTLDSGAGVSIPGAISDDGSGTVVTINGGTNIFGGNDTYSGKTVVNAGTKLALTNGATINNSASITVNNAALDLSFGGQMSSSGALSLAGSSLTLGTNTIGQIASLGVTNTTMNFQVFPPDQTALNITVSGGFSTGGASNVVNLTSVPGYLVYPTNISLIKYGTFGNVNGNNNLTTLGLTLPALGAPVGYLTNNVNNSSIDLVLLSDTNYPIMPLIWKGQLNNNWDLLTTSNWVLAADGVTPFAFQNADTVLFDDTATGPTSINVTTNVSPVGITLNNSAKAYTFSGPGKIGGNATFNIQNNGTVTLGDAGGDSFSGGILLNGASTLILTNSDVAIGGGITVNNGTFIDQHSGTISGGLTINGATSVLLDQPGTITGGGNFNTLVQVGNNDTNGSIPIGAGVTNNTAIVFDRTGTNGTVTAPIYGGGAVTNNNTGTINWFSTNSYTGPTVLNAGIFISSSPNQATTGFHGSSELIINSGAQVQVAVDNSLSGHGAINVLPILINAGGILTGAPGADAGAGTSTHLQGLLTLNGGLLTNSGTSINTANGSWDLDDGVATTGGPVTSIIGCYSVAPTENSGSGEQFDVIAGTTPSGIDLDVTGTIIRATSQSDYGIAMVGNGVMRLSGTNTFTGLNNNNVAVTLNSGVVIVNAKETPGVSGPLGKTTATNAAQIAFTGGTLRYSAVNSFDYSYRFVQGDAYSIDTAGTNVTFATGFVFGSSVTKLGLGTLTLASTTNTYSGATIVGGGTLITTTTATGAGSYAATNDGTLDVQVSSVGGQLAMSSLTLGASTSDTSTLEIDTQGTGNPAVPPINAENGVTTNGTVNIQLAGASLTAGTMPLIAYSGPSPSGLLHLIVPTGFTGTLSDNGSVISVTLAGAAAPTKSAKITRAFLSGTNLVIQGTNNNTPNTSFHYAVLTATNLDTPLSDWTPIATNGFTGGTFNYTNPIVPGAPQQYIDVKAVP